MAEAGIYISYSIAVFIVVLLSGCVLNLLKRHFIFQLAGIAFFFTFSVFKSLFIIQSKSSMSFGEFYVTFLPVLTGICACLISMVLGFWIFPPIRKRFRD